MALYSLIVLMCRYESTRSLTHPGHPSVASGTNRSLLLSTYSEDWQWNSACIIADCGRWLSQWSVRWWRSYVSSRHTTGCIFTQRLCIRLDDVSPRHFPLVLVLAVRGCISCYFVAVQHYLLAVASPVPVFTAECCRLGVGILYLVCLYI